MKYESCNIKSNLLFRLFVMTADISVKRIDRIEKQYILLYMRRIVHDTEE